MQRGPGPSLPPGTYPIDQLDHITKQSKEPPPPKQNLHAAAECMFEVLDKSKIPFALMGGLALKVRGSKRATTDIDIALDCNMHQARQAMKDDPRIIYPAGPTTNVLRTFVRTGGQFNEGLEPRLIAVDLILQGSLGAPTTADMPTQTEDLSFNIDGVSGRYRVLSIVALARAKFAALIERGSPKDFEDLKFLTTHVEHGQPIFDNHESFPIKQRENFANLFRGRLMAVVDSKHGRDSEEYKKAMEDAKMMEDLLGVE